MNRVNTLQCLCHDDSTVNIGIIIIIIIILKLGWAVSVQNCSVPENASRIVADGSALILD